MALTIHWCVDNRGDAVDANGNHVDTSGLEEGILLPPNVLRDVEMVYDWKRGTPVPEDFSDCFNANGAITVDLRAWICDWIPSTFRGHIIGDMERWFFQRSRNGAMELAKFAAKFPTRTWSETMARMVRAWTLTARMYRPGCTIGWYSGCEWHPDQFDRLQQADRDEMQRDCRPPLLLLDRLHPVIYANGRANEFVPALAQIDLMLDLGLGKPVQPIIAAMRAQGGIFTTRDEVMQLLCAVTARGLTDVHLWHAIWSDEEADSLQGWVNDTLEPAIWLADRRVA